MSPRILLTYLKLNPQTSFPTRSSQIWTIELFALMTVIEQLLAKLSDVPLATCTDILESISYCTGSQVALIIHQELYKYTKQGITAFRVLKIYPMTDNGQWWPLLQWKEGNTDVLAIFDVGEENSENCRRLMGKSTDRDHSAPISLAWKIEDVSILTTLFQAAQHLVGILEMPKNDAVKLYCGGGDYLPK
jgi:hypothetical protein